MAQRGIELICGGGRSGLMRAIATAAMEQGGRVTAVVPSTERRNLVSDEFSRVVLVDSLHERKATMSRMASGFIALPGGAGTLEELMEQWSWAQIGMHSKPLGILNVCGYFDPLVQMLDNMRTFGFTKPGDFRHITVTASAPDLLDHLDRSN